MTNTVLKNGWNADLDVPNSLKFVFETPDQVDTGIDLGQVSESDDGGFMGASDGSTSRSALYGNEGYTGNESSSGFGMKDILGGASALVKNNPGLMQTMLAGVAGAYKDKNAREMSQAQLDAIKQRQTDLNNSVPKFGKTIHGKSYKG
jgi:hypothetical protein